jgi:protein O-mannosyl-transferase
MGKKQARLRAGKIANQSHIQNSPELPPASFVGSGKVGVAVTIHQTWWWMAGLLIVTMGVYWNCLEGPFLFDDIITKEKGVAPSVERALSILWLANQRIVPDLTFAICKWWQGTTTASYHVVNVLIHCANGILLFLIVNSTLSGKRLAYRYGDRAPFLAAIIVVLYLVHPLNTESVSYISQRMQSMMSLFQLLSLLALIRSYANDRPEYWQFTAVLAFILSIDSKPHSVAMPILAILYERIFLADSWRSILARSWRMYCGFAWVMVVNVGLMAMHFGDTDIGTVNKQGINVGTHPMTMGEYLLSEFSVMCQYIRLSFVPIGQSLDYMWPLSSAARDIYPYALIIIPLIGLSLWTLYSAPAIGFVTMWFWGNILTTSTFIPRPDLCVEHRMYVPLQAIMVLVVLCGDSIFLSISGRYRTWWPQIWTQRMAIAMAVIAGLALSWLTIQRNYLYASDLAMWNDVTARNPMNFRSHQWIGNYYFNQKSYDAAADNYLQAVRAYPNFYPGYDGLGQSYFYAGKYDLAIKAFQESIPFLYPAEVSKEYENIAVVKCKINDLEPAIRNFQLAIKEDPGNYAARYSLGKLFMAMHRDQEAIGMFRSVLAIKPNHEGAAQSLKLFETVHAN